MHVHDAIRLSVFWFWLLQSISFAFSNNTLPLHSFRSVLRCAFFLKIYQKQEDSICMAKSKKKKKKQTRELMILAILLCISAGLVTAMVTLYNQRKKQASQPPEVNIPKRPEETSMTPVQIPDLPTETVLETVPLDAQNDDLLHVEQLIEDMSLDEKIYQLFIVTPEELVNNPSISTVVQTGNTTKGALEAKPVSGLIYFSQNFEDEGQTISMISDAQNYVQSVNHQIGLWIAVDEEGGSVARVADSLNTTQIDPMAELGQRNDREEVFQAGAQIAEDISHFGFNLDFAPVADVNINSRNELQDRIFSDDPAVVSDLVGAMVEGLQSSGEVSATLKHFPGLGAEDGNTHEDAFTKIDRTYEELDTVDFLPFRSGIQAGADFIMVGHQILSCDEENKPADLSKTVITDWLRGNLNYQGIVITDAHNMNTITENYSSGEAALLSIQAGADIILMPDDLEAAVQYLREAVQNNTLSEERIDESLRRILTAKSKHHLLTSSAEPAQDIPADTVQEAPEDAPLDSPAEDLPETSAQDYQD